MNTRSLHPQPAVLHSKHTQVRENAMPYAQYVVQYGDDVDACTDQQLPCNALIFMLHQNVLLPTSNCFDFYIK